MLFSKFFNKSTGITVISISPFWNAKTLSLTGIHSILVAAASNPQNSLFFSILYEPCSELYATNLYGPEPTISPSPENFSGSSTFSQICFGIILMLPIFSSATGV